MKWKRFRSVLLLLLLQHHFLVVPRVQADPSEADIGRKFSLVARTQFPLVRDYVVQRYLKNIGQRIVARLEQAEFPYEFSVVQDDSLNAFSVPGGYLYFNSGLILRVSSDDELAGVLGHEIAHVQGHHMVRQQQDTKLLSYVGLASMILALINPVLAAGASSLAGAAQMKYLRQLEEEADSRGLQYMRQAGFDPHGMPQFFKKMTEEDRLNPTDVPPYMRSHPMSQERLNYVENLLNTMHWNQTAPSDDFALKRVQAILRALNSPKARLLSEFQQQVADAPNDIKALALLGVVQLRFNDLAPAQQTLEQAAANGLRLDDELGMLYLRLGQKDKARQAFARLSETDPQHADAHNQLCKIFYEEGDLARALQECRTAQTLDPQLDESYLTLAQIAQQQGKSAESRILLAQAMELQGRPEAALAQYGQALSLLSPDDLKVAELEKKREELQTLVNELGQYRR
ncbi:MAG: M48 family metalloprotease [Deltaproteobacteria bacterium]|nr:M48 family metalloprotease [Deltaproteobacteria bacterium]